MSVEPDFLGALVGSQTALADALVELRRTKRRLAKQVEYHQHWKARAVAAEQALGLYGPKETPRAYSSSYCDEATDSGHSSAAGLQSYP